MLEALQRSTFFNDFTVIDEATRMRSNSNAADPI